MVAIEYIMNVSLVSHNVAPQIKCAVLCRATVSVSVWPGFLPLDSQRVLLNIKMVWLSSQFPTVGETEKEEEEFLLETN